MSGKYDKHNERRIVSVSDWKAILENELSRSKEKFSFIDNVLIKIYYAPNKTVFRGEFEKKSGIKGLNLRVGEFRDRIRKLKNLEFEEQINDDTGNERAWNIPFYTDQKLNNTSENKGKFSWVLRDELVKAMEELGLVHPDEDKTNPFQNTSNSKNKTNAKSEKKGCLTRVLFCNVAYMKNYDIELFSETPIYGGSYVADTGDALEKYNFHKCDDNKVKGFVETKYVGGYDNTENKKPKQIRIENIDEQYKRKDFIEDVTVVFCAKNPNIEINKTVIVGWYTKATVYRHRKKYLGRQYNLEAEYENTYLLPESERTKVIPRAASNVERVGFGQSNVWYAKKDSHRKLVMEVLDYIKEREDILKKNEVEKLNLIEDEMLNETVNQEQITPKHFEYTREAIPRKDPRKSVKGTYIYGRDRKKAVNAIMHSKFKCEANPTHLLFNRKTDGLPYLEAHHLVPMSKQGEFEFSLDVEENIVALCSQCHNEIHYGEDSDRLVKKLYKKRKELLEKKKIDVSIDELISYYV